ncbi:DNA-dependent DNA polymerase [bottlenose dolphin adenovirus 2]|uniref:DNA polymerase n=1 Tax=bottlenose dolphin adenovirus 2 TaxID=2849592 RepID=A0A0M4MQY7_9ADEN|nr:DNA-dependent DNA polymerase [Bottlenose dolphin adenovirus 1]ALE15295.1 DNA-dependent DNA polymerase [Bottlenose dolphin adenovirus 1]
MSVVQSDGTSSICRKQGNSKHKQKSDTICLHSSPKQGKFTGTECSNQSSIKLKKRGTLIAKRAMLSTKGTLQNGNHVDVKYFSNFKEALENLFSVNLYNIPTNFFLQTLTPKNIFQVIDQLKPTSIQLISYFKGNLTSHSKLVEDPQLPFPINIFTKHGKIYLIKTIEDAQKCDYCGDYYKVSHTCNIRRRDFYFHHINYKTSFWWEKIPFKPIGSLPCTKRLFVTYDIETYTWHGRHGKQLVPYLLVFNLTGDTELVNTAKSIAENLFWETWNNRSDTFFYLNPTKKEIGNKFKVFRDSLQQKLVHMLWENLINENETIWDFKEENFLDTVDDITFNQLKTLKLKGNPKFIELYIVGHNISGFDEIVLAAQVIANKTDISPAFKISRNFMPRAGKILFNDITFALPNPLYKKRTQFEEWKHGILEVSDLPCQYVKMMVRDTLALTHTSLRNAAQAYNLSVEKGHCPYEAVNSFYRTGSYLKDCDGFPHQMYWQNEEEYNTNKQIWKEKKTGAYDIIQSALDYCAQDVLVTANLVTTLQRSYGEFIANEVNLPLCNFNIFQRPTISSNSHAIFKQILFRKEEIKQNSLSDVLLAPSNEMYDYVRQSIRGGRCYPTYIGILEEPIYVYDICGMYASALTHPFPVGTPLNPFERAIAVNNWEKKLKNKQTQINYFDEELLPGIFTIDADPPDETFLDVLPPFCSRRGGRLCWTNEPLRGEVATSVDVITLHNSGWEVKILPDERTTIFPEWKCVAREYVELNILAKEKADKNKNQTIRSIAKLLSNALYGSFATKLDNKKIVFSDQIDDETHKAISTGTFIVKSSAFIETENLSAEILPEFVVAYPPDSNPEQSISNNADFDECEGPYIPPANHVTYTYKPITFMDVEDDDVCLHTLEKTTPLIENNRYASQIASFVLAWTRVFIAEWANFLYSDDRGTPIEARVLKSVYGDTDSLFVTEIGRFLMETKGKHRIKKNGGNLVFDPKNPKITWLVECETQCTKCGSDAFSPESVFLAPKLYALKSIKCPNCGFEGKGKLRAKGHATSELCYDTLKACILNDIQHGNEHFQTKRMTLKRTLATCQTNAAPFTVTETTLTRTVRPWKDMTLRPLDQHRLAPYSKSNPNPRNTEVCMMSLPWDM